MQLGLETVPKVHCTRTDPLHPVAQVDTGLLKAAGGHMLQPGGPSATTGKA